MITYYFIKAILGILAVFFVLLPKVDVLPWGVGDFLAQGVSGYKTLMAFFPPMSTVLDAFLIYVGVNVAIMVLKFFLGSRVPSYE